MYIQIRYLSICQQKYCIIYIGKKTKYEDYEELLLKYTINSNNSFDKI